MHLPAAFGDKRFTEDFADLQKVLIEASVGCSRIAISIPSSLLNAEILVTGT
jgi:hypothetical protein